jgi:hypothetical protein
VDDGLRVEILSGLTPDEQVILSTGSVSEGAPVRAARHTTDSVGAKAGHGS